MAALTGELGDRRRVCHVVVVAVPAQDRIDPGRQVPLDGAHVGDEGPRGKIENPCRETNGSISSVVLAVSMECAAVPNQPMRSGAP